MATVLSFLSGRQITNGNGVPQNGAKLLHYRATTTTALTVWQNRAGTTAHPQPVPCDSGGFVPLIYVDDTFAWKVVITDANDVVLQTYDNLPAADADVSAAGFAPPLLTWTQVTSAASPVALTAANVGGAYEADTTGGNIEFDLPSAASVGNGKGFWFKKTAAANTMTIDPSGSETIDDVSTSLAITVKDTVIGIFSNGAEWYRITDIPVTLPTVQRFTSGSGTYTPATGFRWIRVRQVASGGGGGATATNNGTAGNTTSFGTWTALAGQGGSLGANNAGGAGGTGGVDGTGTLLARIPGQAGGSGVIVSTAPTSGFGGSSPLGSGGAQRTGATAGAAGTGAGSGGSGGSNTGSNSASGGGAGEYVEFTMTAAQVGASQSYAVGAAGTGGAAGGQAGGNGTAGMIIVEEHY